LRKLVIISLVLLFSLYAGIAAVSAQPLNTEDLLGVFPESPELTQPVTRSAFAAMLVKAANLPAVDRQAYQAKDVDPESWFAPAMATLAGEGIMAGYPGGAMRPEQPLTGVEAAALVSRTLGLYGTLDEFRAGPLAPGHWGSSLYNWLVDQGLISGGSDPENPLTVNNAALFLVRVFGSDPQALAIVEKSGQAQADIKAMRSKIDMDMAIKPKTSAAGEFPMMKGTGKTDMEVVMPATIHQVNRWQFTASGKREQIPEMVVEQYIVDGKMYTKVIDPVSGEAQWMRMPEGALPDMKALVEESMKAGKMGIPDELKPYFHYQLLGVKDKNGQKVHEIGYYGCIDDLDAFMKAALPESLRDTLGGPELEKSLGGAGKMIKSIFYWGREEVGAGDYLPVSSEMKIVISFSDQFQGEAMPVELAEMHIKVREYSFGDQIKIELPPEALQAKEIPVQETGSGGGGGGKGTQGESSRQAPVN